MIYFDSAATTFQKPRAVAGELLRADRSGGNSAQP